MLLKSYIISQNNVGESEKDEMYSLHNQYYENIIYDKFMNDLQTKDWIIILKDKNESIKGFTTIQIINIFVDGKERIFLFSGNTVVDEKCRQSYALAGTFGHFLQRLNNNYNNNELYWFLISKGYRTYRFLPIFFNTFYPVYNFSTPKNFKILLDNICEHKFGKAYNPLTGIINFNGETDYLRPENCEIQEKRLQDPHIAFFLKKNPNFYKGEELACIAPITMDNLNKYAKRVMERHKVTWYE